MKILLVEDDPSTAQFLCATLNSYRYTVDVASDGQTGLELVSQWEYDLIVLDVMIPQLDE
jgi:DNA-binding response OmpR family regulator